MIPPLLAALTLAASWSAAAPAVARSTSTAAAPRLSPADTVAALARFGAPAGWKSSDVSNTPGADTVLGFEDGLDRIAIHVYGTHGSAYKTPADFLKGPAASSMGKPAIRVGSTPVAGQKTELYRRDYPLAGSNPQLMGSQSFCVLPPAADGRFVVLTYSRESPAPDPAARGETAWRDFLKSIQAPLPKP
jgi:hypothetical protein